MRQVLRASSRLSSCWSKPVPQPQWQRQVHQQWRRSHISTPSTSANSTFLTEPSSPAAAIPDAQFAITESPFPLLNVSLSASQNLYTRRGTLVGLGGKAENVISTLSVLEPFRRLVGRIPFLYQRVSSTSPVTALISPKLAVASLAVVHLDGSTDWMVIGRSLLAWTGQTISVRPTINSKMSLAHWGSSKVTGRGLLALAGRGSIAQIKLESEESYIAHPSNVVAYSMNRQNPLPYRLKSSIFRLQIPDLKLSSLIPDTKFSQVIRSSTTWKAFATLYQYTRTWLRRNIWGDRLFLRFHGPTTILLQTRAARLHDVLTNRDVNEIAGPPTSAVPNNSHAETNTSIAAASQQPGISSIAITKPAQLSTARIGSDGKVIFTKGGACE